MQIQQAFYRVARHVHPIGLTMHETEVPSQLSLETPLALYPYADTLLYRTGNADIISADLSGANMGHLPSKAVRLADYLSRILPNNISVDYNNLGHSFINLYVQPH